MTGSASTSRGGRRWWRRHAAVLACVLAIAATAVYATAGGADNTLPDPGWQVTATSATTNLVDGQRVTLNIKSRPDVRVGAAQVVQCRLDVTYSSHADIVPSGGNCPDGGVSSSADSFVVRGSGSGLIAAAQSDAGATMNYRVGVGNVTWQPTIGGPSASLICDPTHPCGLVVELTTSAGLGYTVIPLAFTDSDPLVGCGGVAAGALSTAGSDRMADAWSAWTQAVCKLPGATGAPTRGSFSGEGLGVQSFASGNLDLAYTAAGYDPSVGLGPTDGSPERAAVYTPLALNAAVIAVGGGYVQSTGDKAPYPEIKLTAAEASAMFTGGFPWVTRTDKPYLNSILGTNPLLNGFINTAAPNVRPMGPSEAEASTWFLTNYFASQSPNDWQVPFTGQARGASAALATADPAFPDLDLYTGRPLLKKVLDLNALATSTNGPIWVLTDLATAKALGMTPVSIQNANGEYVAPTQASMDAAVATMKPNAEGVLIPSPSATSTLSTARASTADAAAPYPLTFVEYGMAPAEPLVDSTTCTLRSGSQALLTNWLGYVVGDGQSKLPDGLEPLPPALQSQAVVSMAKVGLSPVSGPCASSLSGPSSNGGGSGTGALATGTLPSGSLPSSLPSTLAGPGATPPAAAAANAADAKGKAAVVAIPAFAGHRLPGPGGGVLALIGIVLITSLAAWLTSGGRMHLATAGGNAVSTSVPPRRVSSLVFLWLGVVIACMGLVVYQLGPLLYQRDQRSLLSEFRVTVRHAANESQGLQGVSTPTKPPEPGSAVGIVEIGSLQTQDVVVEGASSSTTSEGVGHVPGTSGLGQPGNAAIVARRNAFGGAFSELSSMPRGTRIVVTTTQGQSVYVVKSVRSMTLTDADTAGATASPYATSASTSTSAPASTSTSVTTATKPKTPKPAKTATSISVDDLYGPSKDDRLTLVTSGSRAPWNTSSAVVAVAKLQTEPFAPTPQGARSSSETGTGIESGAWAWFVLVLMLYVGAIVASVLLYRRMQFRIGYLLTIAPLVALTILTGEALSRLLPAWM